MFLDGKKFNSSYSIYNRLLILEVDNDFCRSCPNVTSLKIGTQLLLYSKFIDNPSLFSTFQRITNIDSSTKDVYSVNSVSKLVDRFPSLSQIQLRVYSMDICVSIVDLFLCQLAKLSYMGLFFTKNTLVRYPFTRAFVIKKRRERFPAEMLNEQMVNVRRYTEAVVISLS